jgi:hypothetical protein
LQSRSSMMPSAFALLRRVLRQRPDETTHPASRACGVAALGAAMSADGLSSYCAACSYHQVLRLYSCPPRCCHPGEHSLHSLLVPDTTKFAFRSEASLNTTLRACRGDLGARRRRGTRARRRRVRRRAGAPVRDLRYRNCRHLRNAIRSNAVRCCCCTWKWQRSIGCAGRAAGRNTGGPRGR